MNTFYGMGEASCFGCHEMPPFQEKGTFDKNKMVCHLFSSIQIYSAIDKDEFRSMVKY